MLALVVGRGPSPTVALVCSPKSDRRVEASSGVGRVFPDNRQFRSDTDILR